ncbi:MULTISPECIES: hypothetical protein [unclassified Fusibacter]|uniref:hypothetical protein n=1 Tax=unclassified Fusibacter TaxID=2624464 RepID=UPI0010116865|nr:MULTISPECIES: hypothetical protein [unclassified Fusibacter]MCK8058394.1 DUF2569 domain-containing protein [Fusibacter sp. A2]RXV63177.1 hypothetical protein DWB64_04005 [Fusibacter sp. A1]
MCQPSRYTGPIASLNNQLRNHHAFVRCCVGSSYGAVVKTKENLGGPKTNSVVEKKQEQEVENKNEAIFDYLEQHVKDFSPTDDESEFITNKLSFANGKVSIGGWFIFPYIGTMISFVLLVVSAIFLVPSGIITALVTNVALMLLLGFIMYNITKKKRLTIHLFKGYYILAIILKLMTVNKDYTGLTFSVIWLAYFFMSKRVKYTFVE